MVKNPTLFAAWAFISAAIISLSAPSVLAQGEIEFIPVIPPELKDKIQKQQRPKRSFRKPVPSSLPASTGLLTIREACMIRVPLEKGTSVCSGVLVENDLVVTAAHCFEGKAASASTAEIRCGFSGHRKDKTLDFDESFSAKRVLFNHQANQTLNDFAFIILNAPAKTIRPLPVATDPTQFKADFTQPSPFFPDEIQLKNSVDCRSAGFGIDPGIKRSWYQTVDQSPYNGLKGYLNEDVLAIEGYGSEIGKIRQGDSGGPLICRKDSMSPWQVIALASAAREKKKHSHWTMTTSFRFRSFYQSLSR